jgi:hypothetical protein
VVSQPRMKHGCSGVGFSEIDLGSGLIRSSSGVGPSLRAREGCAIPAVRSVFDELGVGVVDEPFGS